MFVTQRGHQEGKKIGLEDEMRRIQRDLDSDLYRDADTRYLHRAADIKVLEYNLCYSNTTVSFIMCTLCHPFQAIEVTIDDLDKFYKALDR